MQVYVLLREIERPIIEIGHHIRQIKTLCAGDPVYDRDCGHPAGANLEPDLARHVEIAGTKHLDQLDPMLDGGSMIGAIQRTRKDVTLETP
jgi:hypothetical protein